jgi:hypothetical protein
MTRKYKIEKRKTYVGQGDTYKAWPWLLTYPNGAVCYCFDHDGAVRAMNDALFALKCAKEQYYWHRKRALPGA